MQLSPLTNLVKTLASSTFVLIVVILCVVDAGIIYGNPLRYLNATNLTSINQNPVVAKLREFLDSSRDPDVVIVGTSLSLVPAVRCDDQFHGVRTRYDRWYRRNHVLEYDKADYLAHLLSEKAGRQIDIANLGVVGSLMSDSYLVVEKTLATGKRPRAIVCFVAPRDFMDNERRELDKTPVYSILADFTAFNDLLAQHPDPARVFDFAVGNVWKFYKMKGDIKTIATTWACRTFDRQASLFLANKFAGQKFVPTANDEYLAGFELGVLDKVKPVYTATPNTLADMGEYKHVYFPINHDMIAEQTPYLYKLLALAKKDAIPVVMVDTPLTRENLALLPPEELQDYKVRLKTAAEKYGALLVEPGANEAFVKEDFEDSCHMNARGGSKFFKQLVRAMVENPTVAESLQSGGTLLGQRAVKQSVH